MLHALLIAPFAAALITAFISSNDADSSAQRWGIFASLVIAALAVLTLGSGSEVVSSSVIPWFTLWGGEGVVTWSLQADAISTWLVYLAVFVLPVVLLAGTAWASEHFRDVVIGLFVMQGAILGCFLAADLVVFYIFFEAMLLPVLILVARYGDSDRRGAALQFFLTTMLASVGMLVAIWYMGLTFGTTRIPELVAAFRDHPDAASLQQAAAWCAAAFLIAFAVKLPMVPFHSWQARIYASAPAMLSAMLAGVMAKVGLYGFIRLVWPIFPEQVAMWTPMLLSFAVVGVLWGALLALVQTDLKRLLAYASLGHLSLILVGLLMREEAAFAGVVVQMVAHGLSVTALFLVVGALEFRRGSRSLEDFGAVAQRAPVLAVLLIGSMLTAVAMPGTASFAGEFLILLGVALSQHGSLLLVGIVGLSLILTAAYLLRMVKAVAYGPHGPALGEAKASETVAIGALLLASVVLGLVPRVITETTAARSAGIIDPRPESAAYQRDAEPAPSQRDISLVRGPIRDGDQ